jgi:outer membrane lipoprotein-sorting protein
MKNLVSTLRAALTVAILATPAFPASAATTATAPALTADEIIAKADAVRNPGESYLMKVEITNTSPKADPAHPEKSVFEVSIQGNDKTLVKTLEPSRDRGRNLLMLEQEMWAYIPNLKRAVRVGLNQRLTGQAANGDISRMRWTGDYSAKIESETASDWVIFLTASKKGLTYEKARVWVRKLGFQPNRAQYLTLSGSPLKEALYEGYKDLAGATRPTLIQISDTVRPDDRSQIKILEMETREFASSLFNQNNLKP